MSDAFVSWTFYLHIYHASELFPQMFTKAKLNKLWQQNKTHLIQLPYI